jgi:CheY-like chemotaxis protein
VSRRLLVLDDDRSLLALLRTYFSGLGWQVDVCAEPDAALRLVDSTARVDAVLCDLHFTPSHRAEGYGIVAAARRRHPRAAVLLVTGAPGHGVREEALRHGADDVIPKPAPLARLRDAVLGGAEDT